MRTATALSRSMQSPNQHYVLIVSLMNCPLDQSPTDIISTISYGRRVAGARPVLTPSILNPSLQKNIPSTVQWAVLPTTSHGKLIAYAGISSRQIPYRCEKTGKNNARSARMNFGGKSTIHTQRARTNIVQRGILFQETISSCILHHGVKSDGDVRFAEMQHQTVHELPIAMKSMQASVPNVVQVR